MATHETQKVSSSKAFSGGTNSSLTTAKFTVPAGQKFNRLKVKMSPSASYWRLRGNAQTIFGGTGFDTWASNVSTIWTDGKGCTCEIRNNDTEANHSGSLVCIFETEDLPTYTVTCSTSGSGTLTSSPTKAYNGQEVTLTPSPGTGYQFSSYSTNPSVTITSNKFKMPNKAITVTANFTKRSYSITVASENTTAGTVSSGGAWQYQTAHTITATPKPGYEFSSWTVSGSGSVANASSASTTFTVGAGTATVTAHFSKLSYTVTVGSEDVQKGAVSGGGTFTHGTVIDIAAFAISPYSFSHWTATAGTIANPSSAVTTFTVPTSDCTVTAHFTADQGIVKYYDGTNFVPCTVYYFDGTNFTQCTPYYYDGTEWKLCSTS